MKYIIFKDFSDEPCAILFPNRIGHLEMREQMPYSTVISAGYVDMVEGGFVCHGSAKELNASPGQKDAEILLNNFRSQGDQA